MPHQHLEESLSFLDSLEIALRLKERLEGAVIQMLMVDLVLLPRGRLGLRGTIIVVSVLLPLATTTSIIITTSTTMYSEYYR